jgi:hypothetical protein
MHLRYILTFELGGLGGLRQLAMVAQKGSSNGAHPEI